MKLEGKTVVVLGGDGFCGWPTALRLAKSNTVICVDNLNRREADTELGTQSLTPIIPFTERCFKASIKPVWLDVTKFDDLDRLIKRIKPDVIIHFAEQRSAPYSMLDGLHSRSTVSNNILGTQNVLESIVRNDLVSTTHLVHLGTMGVYGYSTTASPIPEGYTEAVIGGEKREIVYPSDPGSVYHMTKVMDHQMFQFYAKNWGVRITDLHQGIVWGTQTEDTRVSEELINRFDYDGEYGTVLNRFLVQGVIKHPLTVYGSGGQTRAFIHIQDTVNCIDLACAAGHQGGRPLIFNQVTETRSVMEIAQLVSDLTGTPVLELDNPRKEKSENSLVVSNAGFLSLGWEPIPMAQGLLNEVIEIVDRYIDRVQMSSILSKAKW